MALGSSVLVPFLLLAILLLDPVGLCFPHNAQMREFDYSGREDYVPQEGIGQPTPPSQTICDKQFCPPPPPLQQTDEWPFSHGGEPFPTNSAPSQLQHPPAPPHPPPPQPLPGVRPPWLKQDDGDATPTDGLQKGKDSSSYVAALGWSFLAAALALQLVLGAYLAYQRRELERFGKWVEKLPSISPPPSPAGFAPYTAAR